MRISRIDLYLLKVPLQPREPWFWERPARFYPSWIPGFPQTHMSLYLLELTTDTGIRGYATMNAMGEERVGLFCTAAPYLIGLDPLDLAGANQRLQELSYLGLRNGWIEAAFWDIAGKATGKPVWALLGGEGGDATCYCSTGSVHTPEETRAIVRAAKDAGFHGVKLRVKSLDMDAMVRQVEAAREAGGPDFPVKVDANQGWPVSIVAPHPRWTLDVAVAFAKRCEDFAVSWLEEPLHRGDIEGLRALREATTTPIAGGELNGSYLEARAMLERDALDIYQPDATLWEGSYAGGITASAWLLREVLAKGTDARGRPVRFTPHTWTNGFGFGVNLQVLGAVPRAARLPIEMPHEPPFAGESFSRFLVRKWAIDREGRVRITDAPGLGMEIDWDVVKRFGRRVYSGDARSVGLRALLDRKWHVAMELKAAIEARARAATGSAPSEPRVPDPPFTRRT